MTLREKLNTIRRTIRRPMRFVGPALGGITQCSVMTMHKRNAATESAHALLDLVVWGITNPEVRPWFTARLAQNLREFDAKPREKWVPGKGRTPKNRATTSTPETSEKPAN